MTARIYTPAPTLDARTAALLEAVAKMTPGPYAVQMRGPSCSMWPKAIISKSREVEQDPQEWARNVIAAHELDALATWFQNSPMLKTHVEETANFQGICDLFNSAPGLLAEWRERCEKLEKDKVTLRWHLNNLINWGHVPGEIMAAEKALEATK